MLAALLGAATAAMGFVLGLPGNGSWAAVAWLGGAAAAVLLPARATVGAALVGVVLVNLGLVLSDSAYGGLIWLIILAEAVVLGHGFVVAATVRRALRLRSLGDDLVVRGALVALAGVALFAYFAFDFARNPP